MNDQPDNTPDNSDEEHEHHHQFIMTPFGPISKEEYERKVDEQRAYVDATSHQAARFFDELNEDQLTTFRGIMNALANDPVSHIAYYMAMASSALKYRFGICPACTKKHDNELEKLVETGQAEMKEHPEQLVPEQAPTDEDELRQNAEIWGVKFLFGVVEDDRPLHLTPVECKKGCGATNSTLADRMLRPAGESGCPGCIQKAKTG